jgi:NAD(P)-dependent dehydrogenase (short-subunit alcohol dehydrogenase family)
MSTFANQVVLITGAGSGLGRQFALTLAAEGAAIGAIDLKDEPLAALAQELTGKRVAWAAGDVTDRASLQAAVTQVRECLGPVDLLIASAGIGMENSALQFGAGDFEAQIRVNLIGVANSVETVLPEMLTRRQGHIVGMSSCASYRGLPRMLGYCASKAGLNSLLEGLRVELSPMGVTVTTMCPSWIRTPLTAHVNVPQSAMLDVAHATQLMVEAIRRKRAFYAFPASAVRQVRLLRWLPCGLSDALTRRAFRRMGRA